MENMLRSFHDNHIVFAVTAATSKLKILVVTFSFLRRWSVQFGMTSPQVYQQCIFSPEFAIAARLTTANVSGVSHCPDGIMFFHVTIQVPLCILAPEFRLVNANKASQGGFLRLYSV